MTLWQNVRQQIGEIVNMSEHIDTVDAAVKIKNNIWFRGPNVWILVFSIVIASVGLNVNSTAVIIGAMLISPLMGPIIGIGLSLGTNDMPLFKSAVRNLLVMMTISLIASSLYFIITPLNLVNPTELEARTTPTIYDVLIALFGGLAGILESCRKEKGTVISGVAIATALMPPLCTAGYGLANLDFHFLFGALFLFLINGVFITLATYVMVKYLRFGEVQFQDPARAKRTRTLMTLVILAVIIPSLWSAFMMIRANNFERNVKTFITENKMTEHGYIYDYKIYSDHGQKAEIYFAGDSMSDQEKANLLSLAEKYGLSQNDLIIKEHKTKDTAADEILRGVFERNDAEMNRKDERIKELEMQIQEMKDARIPYSQIAREVRYSYPEIKELSISKGAEVSDSLSVNEALIVVAKSDGPMQLSKKASLQDWLRIRLEDSTAVLYNIY